MSVGFKDRYDFSHKDTTGVGSAYSDYGDAIDPVRNVSLTLNGHQRWPADMDARFFRLSTPYNHWRTLPSTPIYTFSFATNAAEWNPTSTLNMSRLDNVALSTSFADSIKQSELVTFVEAYNVLVVDQGLGGLRYSN